MEAFSSLLHLRVEQGLFSYHPKCRELQICHLAFADDLFIMCEPNVPSFTIINDLLNEFHSFSGLKPNTEKSSIFYAGVEIQLKEELGLILPIPEANLPVRYLGVPLISARLRSTDCTVLKEKILRRIHGWSTKKLSYSGRAQLIQSVLFTIQVYWSSIFILPSKVVKEIESSLMAFLWSGPDMRHTGAKVKWDHICRPKAEGGLGFRKVKEWNKATMLKHLWALCKKADSLWVKWVHTYIIKNQSLWHMDTPRDSSWTIRKIFGMRSLGQPLIQYRVGNGKSTFLWFDNWHPLGPFYKRLGEEVVYNLGASLNAKVSSIIHQGQWKWPRSKNRITQSIIHQTPATLHPDCTTEDLVVWLPSSNGFYSARSAWEAEDKIPYSAEDKSCLVHQECSKVGFHNLASCSREIEYYGQITFGEWLWMRPALYVAARRKPISIYSLSALIQQLCGLLCGVSLLLLKCQLPWELCWNGLSNL